LKTFFGGDRKLSSFDDCKPKNAAIMCGSITENGCEKELKTEFNHAGNEDNLQ